MEEKLTVLEEKRHRLVLILGDLERRAKEETRSEIEDLTMAIIDEIRHRGRSKN